jgi:pyruvate dehydrogenase E2 component (dihydrolipoamide acetyltransferase)
VATPVTMPQLGETVVEGTITRWLKNEGDDVERDEPLFEISTDKVDTEVPSPLAGRLVEIKVQEGETVSVGTELAMIDTDGAAAGDGQVTAAEPPTREAAPGAETEPEEAERSDEAAPPEEAERSEEAAQPEPPAAAEAEGRAAGGGPMSQVLSPLVRRLADEHGIDLAQVRGTGMGGRVSKKDVMQYLAERGQGAAGPQPSEPPPAPPGPAPVARSGPQPEPAPAPRQPAAVTAGQLEEVVPLTRMRQAIAKHMVASMQTSARAWNMIEVNMEHVAQVRAAAKDAFQEREGLSLTFMPFVARAVCEALMAFPDVNGELREDQLILKRYVNLGIAVALDEGLIVPVVKGADSMSLVGLASAVNDVATRARSKKLAPDEVHGSTFTITNPGPFGSILSVPIINQPNCAILAFDAIEKRPVVVDDAIAIRHMVYLSMSWDHRIIDGATAAKFLGRLKQNLETWDFGPEVGLAPQGR